MKKMIALLLTALMGLSLTACGGDGGSKDTGLPGVDMKSTEVQAVTSDRAELAVLNETFATYLGGLNYFTIDEPQSKMTYADLRHTSVWTAPSTGMTRTTSAAFTPGTPPRMKRAR